MDKKVTRCMICGNDNLVPVVNLGNQALTGVFPKEKTANVHSGPLELLKCHPKSPSDEVCHLVQLSTIFSLADMYGMNYGYRSGLNQSMVAHLREITREIESTLKIEDTDLIIDVGSNDSTLLRSYENQKSKMVGIDPSGIKFKQYYPAHIELIPDFFPSQALHDKTQGRKAKVITSIAMFYDLEKPMDFVSSIRDNLADNGIWVFEQSYLPAMLNALAYDTICHEHLEYYALRQIKWMLDRNDLKIVGLNINDTNGGSFRITAAKRENPSLKEFGRLSEYLIKEEADGLLTTTLYDSWRIKIDEHKKILLDFLIKAKGEGKKVLGYGASTKGNVVLQYCGITSELLPYIAEVNPDKFGAFSPGSRIPIISEQDALAMKPDYYLVLPWHFRANILAREKATLESGVKFVFPLPRFEIVGRE